MVRHLGAHGLMKDFLHGAALEAQQASPVRELPELAHVHSDLTGQSQACMVPSDVQQVVPDMAGSRCCRPVETSGALNGHAQLGSTCSTAPIPLWDIARWYERSKFLCMGSGCARRS